MINSSVLLDSLKTMYIIGNSKVKDNLSSKIDSADLVVRFNNMNNYNLGTGTKINTWVLSTNTFLINQHINGSQLLIDKLDLSVKHMISITDNLLFSIPPFLSVKTDSYDKMFQHIQREDRKERIFAVSRFLKHFEANNHPFRIIEFPKKYISDISPEIWSPLWTCPSNGYLVTRMLVDDPTFYRYKKYLVGFTWEGWEGHPWILERLYLEKMERDDLITIVK